MHKRFVNHCTIRLSLIPQGPVLIKSGSEGADPTKPSMEFVETYHKGGKSIYFPGSSLKGAIRAHAERIVRTVGGSTRPSDDKGLWASDPLDDRDKVNNPNQYLNTWKTEQKDAKDKHPHPGAELYRQSCFTTQLFGSTAVASRFRIEDAYPIEDIPVRTEERNGVAIDRVLGSVAQGPFSYQVCTAGDFRTKIHLKNFTLEQLGLVGLVLRDLSDGWFCIGFAKSRGMGSVAVNISKVTVDYPGCILKDERTYMIGTNRYWAHNMLIGAGAFLTKPEREKYGFPSNDEQPASVVGSEMAYGLGVRMSWSDAHTEELFSLAVAAWRKQLEKVAV